MKLICVTNRLLCEEDFLHRIRRIASSGVDAILPYSSSFPFSFPSPFLKHSPKKHNIYFPPSGYPSTARRMLRLQRPMGQAGSSPDTSIPLHASLACRPVESHLSAKSVKLFPFRSMPLAVLPPTNRIPCVWQVLRAAA